MNSEKKRIALLFIYNDIMSGAMEEVGSSFIAAYLRKNGYEVLLASYHEERVNYERIRNFNPGIIGFPIYYLSKENIKRVASNLKEILPGAFFCGGGIHATINSEKMLNEISELDVIVRGEGEETFLELVNCLNNGLDYTGIKGLSYRSGNKIIENDARPLIEDLNTLPFPARDMLVENKMKIATLSTSRGCKSHCSFCASQLFWNIWRGRSVNHIVDEIQYVIQQYDVRVFNFIDSSFEDPDKSLKRLSLIAKEIIKRELELYYFVDVRAEIHKKLTPSLIEILKQSGLWSICIGIESANEEDLRLFTKIATVEDNCKAIELFKENGITINPGFINFNPYSTIKRLKENLDFLIRYDYPSRFISRLTVFEGTNIFKKLESEKMIIVCEDSYRYRFTDEKIGKLCEFLFNYTSELESIHGFGYHHLDYFSNLFGNEIILYHKILMNYNEYKLVQQLDQLIDGYKEIVTNFNNAIIQWFGDLLDILEKGWDYDRISGHTEEVMPLSRFVEFYKNFSRMKKKLLLLVSRAGYSSILIKL